jgi:hypothetical protein
MKQGKDIVKNKLNQYGKRIRNNIFSLQMRKNEHKHRNPFQNVPTQNQKIRRCYNQKKRN